MRRSLLILVAALLVATTAYAGSQKSAPAKHGTDKGSLKQCTGEGKDRSCKRIAVFSGHNAGKSQIRSEPLEKPSGNISIKAENLGEELTVNIYKKDGSFDEAVLAQLDNLWRCTQTGEVRAVRAELYEQLSRIYDHFEGQQVQLVSGFRFGERNSSRHYHASAMDIRIPGVSVNKLYAFAETLDAGGTGLGIYPTGQFIHFEFRAPGEPSFRWVDYSGHSGKKKPTGRTQPARKPSS
jgi:uncharacterized protein YcbK (DUF882 family)